MLLNFSMTFGWRLLCLKVAIGGRETSKPPSWITFLAPFQPWTTFIWLQMFQNKQWFENGSSSSWWKQELRVGPREISRDLSVLLNENVLRYQPLSVIPAVINMLLLYEIRLTQFQCCDRWRILDKGVLDATSHIAGRHLTPTLPAHSFSEWWHIFLVAAQLGRSSCCSRSPPLFAQFCNQDISGSQLEEKRTSDPHIA